MGACATDSGPSRCSPGVVWPGPTNLSGFLATFLPQVWAPTVIALTLVGLSHGAGGVRTEVAERLRYRRGSAPWLTVAAITPAIATAFAVAAARFVGDGAGFAPSDAVPLAIGMQIISGTVGEELGWRGFLLPRLRKHYGPLTAAWVMGSLWSVWHLPAWFNPWLPHRTFPLRCADGHIHWLFRRLHVPEEGPHAMRHQHAQIRVSLPVPGVNGGVVA